MRKSLRSIGCCGIILAGFLLGIGGCGKSSDAPAPGAAGGADASATAAKPGFIVGKITRPDGSPIGMIGAKFVVNVSGLATAGGAVSYMPPVDAYGNFSEQVAPGTYALANATMKLPFNGGIYIYNLVPVTMLGDTPSDKGIVANFIWQVSGPLWTVKDNPDPTNFTHWFGGSCTLQWDGTYKVADGSLHSFEIPVGAKFVFKATPIGKQIDGMDGKPRTWERTWQPLGLGQPVLNDMPATSGGWHITGQETDPDGKTFAIQFEGPGAPAYVPGVDVQFKPDQGGTSGFWPVALMINRPAP